MTPKNREELIKAVARQVYDLANERTIDETKEFIEGLESLGIRLVPAEPTEEMIRVASFASTRARGLRHAIAVSPFAPEDSQ